MAGYFYIALTIFFTVYGQMILKWRLLSLEVQLPAEFIDKLVVLVKLLFDVYILSGVTAALFASLAWIAAMTKFELSYAYPFMALNFVLVFILSALVLGESISFGKALGLILIISGTVITAKC